MAQPLPTLKPSGKATLDSLLKEKIDEGKVPCIFWAATNAKETIYENQVGNNVMGDVSSGEVNTDSSEPTIPGTNCGQPDLFSTGDVLNDQVYHLCESLPLRDRKPCSFDVLNFDS